MTQTAVSPQSHIQRNIFLLVLITLIFSVLTLISLLYFSRTTQQQIHQTVENLFNQAQQEVAREAALTYELQFTEIRKQLEIIAQIPDVREGDGEECNQTLKQLIFDTKLEIDNLGRVNADGIFYCGALDSTIGVDGNQYEYIRQILNDPLHQPVLSRSILFEYADGTAQPLVALHVPVYTSAGKFNGTIGAAIWLPKLSERFIGNIQFVSGGYAALLDDNGDILYHPNHEYLAQNIDGDVLQPVLSANPDLDNFLRNAINNDSGTDTYLFQGSRKVGAFTSASVLPNRSLSIAITAPVEEIENITRPLLRSFNREMIFLFAFSVLTTLIVVYVLVHWNTSLNKEVRAKTASLEKAHSELQTTIAQLRTTEQDLRKKMTGVEGINKLLVARELKMIELKKQISILQEKSKHKS